MSKLPSSIQNLIDELSKLPGIGPKSASRLVFYLLSKHADEIKKLGEAALNLKAGLKICSVCFNFAEVDPCGICSDPSREKSKLAVVSEPLDVLALDRAGYRGLYFVLGGVISPIEGIEPDDLRIKTLVDKIRSEVAELDEVILATNPSLEGEATAMFVSQKLKPLGTKITRLARGLPVGGDLEYADEMTLTRALEGRREY